MTEMGHNPPTARTYANIEDAPKAANSASTITKRRCPICQVVDLLADRILEPLLRQFEPPPIPVSLVFQTRPRRDGIVRAFVDHMGRPPSLTPAQQKEATRRRTQGATLRELADSYDRSIATMRRATRAA
jgi:hypothetical protein